MKAAFFAGPKRIEIREVALPHAGPGEVVVRVRNCGICGSDLHFFHGEVPAPGVCPGHEISGEVESVGDGVDAGLVGLRVAVEPQVVCRHCWYCLNGQHQLCRGLRILGMTDPGGLAERVAVPAYTLYPLPDALDCETGALAEPAAVAVHGVRLVGVGFGDRVLVLGAGTIGLLCVLAARAAGAAEVLITARHEHQAELAGRLGATRVFGADVQGEAELSGHAAGGGIDVVLETVGGRADTVAQAIGWVRSAGRVGVLGVFTEDPRIPGVALVAKEVRLVGSMTYDRVGPRSDFDLALQLLRQHVDGARQLVTHRVSLDAAGEGFELASDKRSGAIKVTITP